MEYVSLEGLRLDGRRPKETRQIRCQMSVLPNADGSAMFEAGNTKVLAAVHGGGSGVGAAVSENWHWHSPSRKNPCTGITRFQPPGPPERT